MYTRKHPRHCCPAIGLWLFLKGEGCNMYMQWPAYICTTTLRFYVSDQVLPARCSSDLDCEYSWVRFPAVAFYLPYNSLEGLSAAIAIPLYNMVAELVWPRVARAIR